MMTPTAEKLIRRDMQIDSQLLDLQAFVVDEQAV
jgi:hypothetical protein